MLQRTGGISVFQLQRFPSPLPLSSTVRRIEHEVWRSAAEILTLYEQGVISGLEVLNGAWEQCHDRPTLRAELIRQFREYPDRYIANLVGNGLEKLAAQLAERGTRRTATGDPAEQGAAADGRRLFGSGSP